MGEAKILNAFSVDLEDWYQCLEVIDISQWSNFEDRVERSTRKLLEILEEFGVRATFFVLGYVAEKFPHLVREVAECGHKLGVHGYSHRQIFRQRPCEFREEVRRAKHLVEDITGLPAFGFRAPIFSITKASLWALDILVEEGFLYDSSIFPAWNYRYGIPSANLLPSKMRTPNGGMLVEIPVSCVKLGFLRLPVGGGAYLRLWPYKVTRWGIRRLNKMGLPAVFYIHPWELDPSHPIIPLPKRISLTHYANLKSTEFKLKRLLSEFSFAPIEEVFSPLIFRGEEEE